LGRQLARLRFRVGERVPAIPRWRVGRQNPTLRFQPPPVDPGMRFFRTRLTDALHRRCSTGARQGRFGLGATTMPFKEIRPRVTGDW